MLQTLRAVRKARGLTLQQVARRAGLDPAYLSRIERGKQRPSVDALAKVGRVLHLKDLVRQIDLYWPNGKDKAEVG